MSPISSRHDFLGLAWIVPWSTVRSDGWWFTYSTSEHYRCLISIDRIWDSNKIQTKSLLALYPDRSSITWIKDVNLCLSAGGLPLDPGYSKSRSRPSKLWLRRKLMDVVTKSARFDDVDNMAVTCCIPMFQPPTASNTDSDGFCDFRPTTLPYLQYKCM